MSLTLLNYRLVACRMLQYLDVPFLKLKQQVLRDQLRTAERDLREANMESDDVIGTLDYDDYVAQYQARAR